MRKPLFIFLILVSSLGLAKAQMQFQGESLFGNEWIDYDQTYVKLKVAEDGLYRVPASALAASGLSLSAINHNQIAVYSFGKEVPVRVVASDPSSLASNDYIEFYGEKNRGELDKTIYQDPETRQLNPEYSLFSDTSVYFLTVLPSGTGQRMQEAANDIASPPAREEFYMHTENHVYSDFHLKQTWNGADKIRYSSLDIGEGFGSELLNEWADTFALSNIYSAGPAPQLSMRFSGNFVHHKADIRINGTPLKTIGYAGYVVNQLDTTLSSAALTPELLVTIDGIESENDRYVVAYTNIIYPRSFDFGGAAGAAIDVPVSTTSRYYELENLNLGTNTPVIYDITSGVYMQGVVESGVVKFVLPASSTDRTIIVQSESAVKAPETEVVEFINYAESNANYILISNKKLSTQSTDGIDWIKEYADYRRSTEGGEFNVVTVDVDQLYDQYSYGINRHSVSIRNFLQEAHAKWQNAEYVFIIGKGRDYASIRTGEELLEANNIDFQVPTFGSPGGDNLLISAEGSSMPLIPIGRLAARNPAEVKIYLDKVRLHENPEANEQTVADQLWKKKIMHLSGGSADIQELIYGYLKDMGSTIEDNIFGADITTYRKTSADPIQSATSEKILKEINDGTAIITFFGHSGVGTFDFSLEEPSEYDNYGRYPVIISLGCHSGNIHSEGVGVSEDFVIEADKGAIAFIASAGSAYIFPQYNSGKDFYDLVGNAFYGQSIGKVLQEAIRLRDSNRSIAVRTLNEQLTLHGDPALRLHPKEGPDYVFDVENVSVDPAVVSTNLDSFSVNFDVVNLGLASTKDSLDIRLQHITPNDKIAYEEIIRVPGPGFRDNYTLVLPVPGVKAIGKNTIRLALDINNSIIELPSPEAESNNNLQLANSEDGFCFYFLDNAASPVAPSDFSIVSSSPITLRASTSNSFLETQKYIIEIDTTLEFDSPLLNRTEIVQEGGLIQWEPDISVESERVFYWRISPDSTVAEIGYQWTNSSFVYLPEEPITGWNQSHFYQYQEDEFKGIEFQDDRRMTFDTAGVFIAIHNRYINPDVPPGYQVNFENYAISVRPWNYQKEGIAIVIGDATTGGAWRNNGGDFGSIVTGDLGGSRTFSFHTKTASDRAKVVAFLDGLPDDSYVFLFSISADESANIYGEEWGNDPGRTIFDVLEEQGAQLVRQLSDKGTVPYNFIYRKNLDVLGEDIGDAHDSYIKTDVFMPIIDTRGSLATQNIGPAVSWQSVEWKLEDKEVDDQVYLRILAVRENGTYIEVAPRVTEASYDVSSVDAKEFPFLRLEYYATDAALRTVPQLEFWRVQYEGLPEAALNPQKHLVFQADTLLQGQNLHVEMAIDNISSFDMDSLLVRYSILDKRNNEVQTFDRMEPLLAGKSLTAVFDRNTLDFSGTYQFSMEINPGQDQPETYAFNNFGIRQFFVFADELNPLLDVTFDGVHILNGDIISSSPYISIILEDDNPYRAIDDISAFDIALEYPDGSQVNIPLDDPNLSFTAGTIDNNKARLDYTPQLAQGKYKLFVTAKDASGNFSGKQAYEVEFEVITDKTVTKVLNYPNPFSTSTQFVYEITGEIPSVFTIQIMTLSGKVVKEITKEELGLMRMGINKSDYRWDGTDDFGQRLANGVYLYRVITKGADGLAYDHRAKEDLDVFFKQEFGKLVIMR